MKILFSPFTCEDIGVVMVTNRISQQKASFPFPVRYLSRYNIIFLCYINTFITQFDIITTLISGLSPLFKFSCILPFLNREAYHNHRQRLLKMSTFSPPLVRSGKVIKKNTKRCFWIRLEELVSGGTILWKILCIPIFCDEFGIT